MVAIRKTHSADTLAQLLRFVSLCGQCRLLVLAMVLALVTSCASNEELFAQYNGEFCEADIETIYIENVPEELAQVPLELASWTPAVYFDFDIDRLRDKEIEQIRTNVELLKKYPHFNVSVRGFTDDFGPKYYNVDLSTRRAKHVVQLLLDAGLNQARISAIALGESAPLVISDFDNDKGISINRRVEMILLDKDFRPSVLMYDKMQVSIPDELRVNDNKAVSGQEAVAP